MKAMLEKRNEKIKRLREILDKAKTETRALSTEESGEFEKTKGEIAALDTTIAAMEEQRALEAAQRVPGVSYTAEQVEERAFADYVRGVVTSETRANIEKGDNNAVIPATIANKIIKMVYDICPIYQMASRYNVKGTFSIPYYDEATDKITVEYATEFTDPVSHGGKFLSIELKGFLARAFSLISKSLANNSSFDIVGFIIRDMAQAISRWIEKELLNGTADKIDGLKGVTRTVTTAAATAITADELIDLQEEVPDLYQADAIFIMSTSTRTAIRKLKDSEGNYLLNRDMSAKWGYTLLGKPVYTSENMSDITAGKTSIYYGDFSGLAVKISEEINIIVLREKYAEQHAIGVVGFVEIDSKVENAQKIAKLVQKTV